MATPEEILAVFESQGIDNPEIQRQMLEAPRGLPVTPPLAPDPPLQDEEFIKTVRALVGIGGAPVAFDPNRVNLVRHGSGTGVGLRGTSTKNFGAETMRKEAEAGGRQIPISLFVTSKGDVQTFPVRPFELNLAEGDPNSANVLAHEARHSFHDLARIKAPTAAPGIVDEEHWNRVLDGWYANDESSWNFAVRNYRQYFQGIPGFEDDEGAEKQLKNILKANRDVIEQYEHTALQKGENLGIPVPESNSFLQLLEKTGTNFGNKSERFIKNRTPPYIDFLDSR